MQLVRNISYLFLIFIFASGFASYLATIGLSFSAYSLLIIFLIFVLEKLYLGKIYIDGKLIFIILLVLLNCLYFVFFSATTDALPIFFDFIASVIMFLIVYLTLNQDTILLFKKAFPILSIATSILIIFTYINPELLVSTESDYYLPGRGTGLLVNPNLAGTSLVSMLGLIFVICKKQTALLCLGFATLAIFLTFSRSSWIFFLFFLFIFRDSIQFKNIIFFTILGFLSLFLVIFLFFQFQGENVLLIERYIETGSSRLDVFSLTQESTLSETDQDRFNLINRSLREFENNILFGNGYGYTSSNLWTQGTHNMHLRFLVEMGLFGYLFYFTAYGFFFVKYLSEKDHNFSKLYLLFFVLLFFCAFFSHNFFESYTIVFMVAVVSCLDVIKQR